MTRDRLDFIDFAKGFAILSIVVFHYSQPYTSGFWSKAIMIGGAGVHLFFILSGFGLGLSSTKMELSVFYQKRFSRVLIPYYIAILLIFIVNEIYPIYGDTGLYGLGGHIFLYKMFDERIMGSYGYHFWFISTIVQFYVAFPLIIKIRKRLSSKNFLLLSLLVSLLYWILISVLHMSHLRVCNSFFLQYLWEFNLGIVWAEKYLASGEQFWRKNSLILLGVAVAGIGLMALMVLKGGWLGRTFNDIPASIGYLGLVAFTYSIAAKMKISLSVFSFVGKISYELYLLHMLVFILINELILKSLFQASNIYASLLVVLPVSVLISNCYSFLISRLYVVARRN